MPANPVRLTLPPVKALDSGKVVSAEEAASLIQDGDTIATGGFVGIGFAEEIALEIETLYLAKSEHAVPTGNKPQKLAIANQIEAYNLPQGVISHLFRDIAAKRPGHLTRVGLCGG
jgi:propionate CoA-transferase